MKHLPGSDKYRVSEDPETKAEYDGLIERANGEIPVLKMLWELGCTIPAEAEKSWKFRCPYGQEHSDGGVSKAARYYPDTNSAFCFDGHGPLTPVKMVARKENLSYEDAAIKLLTEAGLLEPPKSYQERFAELQEGRVEKKAFNPAHAIQALRDWLSDQDGYMEKQYEVDIRETLVYCIDVLYGMSDPPPEVVRKWLNMSKQAMTKVLERG